MTRLADLRAAPTLEAMRQLPGGCHELTAERKGQLALHLTDGKRLVFKPREDADSAGSAGGLDWTKIVAVTLIEIVDYHRD